MTLIFEGAHVLNNAVVCTSDSRVVKYKDYDTKGTQGDPTIMETRDDKVIRLANGVLYRAGGIKELSEHFLKRLKKKVRDTDSLDACLNHAQTIYDQLVKEKSEGKGSHWLKYLYDEHGFVISLIGFDNEGKASLGMFSNGQWSKYNHDMRWSCTGVSPSDDVLPYVNRFNRIEEPGIHHMYAEFWQAHREMANNNRKTISDDMYVHIIKNTNGVMSYFNFHLKDVNNEDEALGYYQALINAEEQINEQMKEIS